MTAGKILGKPEKEIERLFSSSEDVSGKVYSSSQIKGLPAPLQRYFRYALREGQKHISYARLRHTGKFRTKPGQKWMSIRGEEYFTTQNPGFVWFGKVPLFSATDLYINGRGSLKVRLLSLIKIVDAEGKETDQGELLRWLGEAAWYPTALLPSEKLRWEAIGKNSAKAVLTVKKQRVEGVFFFNEKGQMTRFKTKRYMGKSLESWTGRYLNYKEAEGIKIPCDVEVEWNLSSGNFSYARFSIAEIQYNRPFKFG